MKPEILSAMSSTEPDTEREFHPLHARKCVDQDRNPAALRLFEQKRRAAGLYTTVGKST